MVVEPASEVEPRQPGTPRAVRTWLDGALTLLALGAVVSWVVLVVVHVDDWYRVDHGAGVRMALADRAADGVMYPPLHADGFYGGSRYMPLSILLHAALYEVTGDVLVSGKILGIATVAALAVVIVWLLWRRLGCPAPLAAALGAALLVSDPGLGATFGMRADALPAVLQLAAVGVAMTASGPVGVVVAAVLAGLAFTSKITAAWAVAAIVAWLLPTDRRRAAKFAAAYVLVVVALLLIFVVASGGRLADVFALTFAGVGGLGDAITAPYRLLRVLFAEATMTWALLPLAAWGFISRRQRPSADPLLPSFVAASVITLVVFTDIGVGVNQVIDLTGLVLVGTGLLIARARDPMKTMHAPRMAIAWSLGAVVVLWVVGSGMAYTMGTEVPAAIAGAAPGQPLVDKITPDTTLLSEDPGVPVALGRTPVVLDPFMLLRLEKRNPDAVDALAMRIRRHEFDLIVLLEPLDDDSGWWQRYHFGDTVVNAMRDAYASSGTADGYHLYVPAS